MTKHLELKAYGKINLGLDVLRRRDDGYHEVRMIMQTVGIFDRIYLIWQKKPGISIETNLFYLPANENNLAYRAARLLMEEFSVRNGIRIILKKHIPVAAGMAGGSSDAAAVLFGVNKMFHLGLGTKELMERGMKIGADVPYCVMRGTALSEGIGEILTSLPPPPQCHVLIAKPGISVPTSYVYGNLNLEQIDAACHPDIDAIAAAVRDGDLRRICSNMGNVLETVTIRKYPIIQQIKDFMTDCGAVGSLMSGSGPTVFGLYDDQMAAKEAFNSLRYGNSQHLAKQVYLTGFFNPRAANASARSRAGRSIRSPGRSRT